MEIYREKVRDLLAPSESPLKLREHPQLGPHVQGTSFFANPIHNSFVPNLFGSTWDIFKTGRSNNGV